MAKEINVRIGNKYDTAANWERATFIPLKGELIIYAPDPDNGYPYERIKIGDGVTPIGALSFIDKHIEETLYGSNIATFTFNDDLNESTFPLGFMGKNHLDVRFETAEPIATYPSYLERGEGEGVPCKTFKSIQYGYDNEDEGTYFIIYVADNDWVAVITKYTDEGEDIEFLPEYENAKTIYINTDTLTNEAKAFLKANGKFEGEGLIDRVTAIENELHLSKSYLGKYTFNTTIADDLDCSMFPSDKDLKDVFEIEMPHDYVEDGGYYSLISGMLWYSDGRSLEWATPDTISSDFGVSPYVILDQYSAPLTVIILTEPTTNEFKAFLDANGSFENANFGLVDRVTTLEEEVDAINKELYSDNAMKFTFNEDLDESTFPEDYNRVIWFDFETLEPLRWMPHEEDEPYTHFKGIHYGIDWGDEGGYFIGFLISDDLSDGYWPIEIPIGSYDNNSEVAEIAEEAAKTIIINKDTLTDEARAFLEANGTFEVDGLVGRVTDIENELYSSGEKTYGTYEFKDFGLLDDTLTDAGLWMNDWLVENGYSEFRCKFKVVGEEEGYIYEKMGFFYEDDEEWNSVYCYSKVNNDRYDYAETGFNGQWSENCLQGVQFTILEEVTDEKTIEMLNNCCTKIAEGTGSLGLVDRVERLEETKTQVQIITWEADD